MRAVLIILIVAIVAVIAAIATGFLVIRQVRGAKVPDVSASGNGVTAQGGQAPAFDIETGSVQVGATNTTVQAPTVQVQKPGAPEQPVSNNAM